MKLTIFNFILFYQFIQVLAKVGSHHMDFIGCPKDPQCMENLDEGLLRVIKRHMKTRTHPCGYFWNHACAAWNSGPYYDHVDTLDAMTNYYGNSLIETLKKLQTTQQDIKELVDTIMKYYLSCTSMEKMALYLKELPVLEIFGESFRWTPSFQEDDSIWQSFNWLKAAASLRKYGFKEFFLQESVGFASNNSQQYVVQLKMPSAKSTFENKLQILQIMQEFELKVGNNNTNNYSKLAEELYDFDRKLRELYERYEHTKQDHFVSLQDLSHLAPDVDWSLYFGLFLNQVPPPDTAIEFLGNLNYFKDLDSLLKQTAKNVQGFYILIRLCQYLMNLQPHTINGQQCMLQTNVMFPLGVNYIYNRFLYENRLEDEQVLQNLFSSLKHEFSEILKENKFSLSDNALQYLQDKLNLMQIRIGNLPVNVSDINHYYSSVHLKERNFPRNHLEMLKFRNLQQHQPLLDPKLKSLNLDTYYVNDDISQLRNTPYFIHQRNTLIVPMVFLQLPFYHYALHPVFQISLMGWIIAHELSHAFDTHGLRFDAWGNDNLLGLQLSRQPAYLSTIECLVKHSPTDFPNERMADVNGLQLAWQVLANRYPRYDELYGGFPLRKLFFISFAQFFCSFLPTPVAHDRDDVRVRQLVTNSREFAEAFQCPRGVKENPIEKCYIWKK